jgi:protein AbiQ
MNLKFYTINEDYINFLRSYPKLSNIFDNKENTSNFSRKYLGVVLSINEYKYYVPISSPKSSDYIVADNSKVIKKSIIPIIRIVVENRQGKLELKGTLKLSNMIPVPDNMLTYYDFSTETDMNYRILMEKEYDFIRKNKKLILKNASILYNQKTKENELYPIKCKKPGYLKTVVDFKYAEEICDKFLILNNIKTD